MSVWGKMIRVTSAGDFGPLVLKQDIYSDITDVQTRLWLYIDLSQRDE